MLDIIAPMADVGMHEAKTHLSQLVERALAGEEIVVTRRGKPAVQTDAGRGRRRPQGPVRLHGRRDRDRR